MSTQKIEIGSSTIFRIILILISFWLLFYLRAIVVMLFGAFIIASAIEPLVNRLSKLRVPRGLSIAIVYLALILIVGGVVGLLLEPLAQQAYQLGQAIPDIVNRAGERLPINVPTIDQAALVDAAQNGLLTFGDNVANVSRGVFAGTRAVFGSAFTVLFMFILAFYLTLERDAVKKFARLVTPKEHHSYLDHIITQAQKGVGRWVLGVITLGTSVGILIGVGLWILGVPYALLLAILAGVLEILPVIGPIIAGVVGVSVSLSQSFTIALIAVALYVVVGLIESYVLIPNIMRRAVGIKPAVTLIAVIIGAQLGGIVGIILAVPITTVLRIVLSDIFGKSKS